jgi:hypothetical protein
MPSQCDSWSMRQFYTRKIDLILSSQQAHWLCHWYFPSASLMALLCTMILLKVVLACNDEINTARVAGFGVSTCT